MSWPTSVVLEFLELYRQEEHLWDTKHPHHRDRCEVNNAWQRIHSSMNISCSIKDLKKKKESLMSLFRKHMADKNKSPNFRTTWFAFPLMYSFLGSRYENSNISISNSNNSLDQEFYSNGPLFTESPVIEHVYTPRSSVAVDRVSGSNSKKSTTHTKSKDLKTKNEFLIKKLEPLKPVQKRDPDEIELYGQLLVKKLRKLDEHQLDVAMHEIDNILFRAKMQSSNSQSQSRSYSRSPSPATRKVKSPLFIITQQSHTEYGDEIIYQEEDPMQTQNGSS